MAEFDFSSDDVLLDIDSICKKLCISRSSLERLRRSAIENLTASFSHDDYSFIGAPPFPAATVTIGRSPRWSAKVLNAWIKEVQSKRVGFNRGK